MFTFQDIVHARDMMQGIVEQTPLIHSQTFSSLAENEVFLKLENLQKTGSFKVRGSYNKIYSLKKEELKHGVVAASAGNHAQGVAYAGSRIGIPCTIVMPEGAPLSKIEATKGYGADVELRGKVFDDALDYAFSLKEELSATFIHPFDDEKVIAGQGTVGLEILEQLPETEVIVSPVGGGGLIAGIAAAVKERNPSVQIYGVEAKACPSMGKSLTEKKVLTVESEPTMADGIAVKRPGELTFQLVQKYVDGMLEVDEREIARAMLLLLERNKLLVEGAGAVSLAALLSGRFPVKRKKTVAVISGGNVDISFLSRIIERGMFETGRFMNFETIIKDKPGNLEKVLEIIAEQQGNVMDISLSHIGDNIYPNYAKLSLTIETRNRDHIRAILAALEQKGYSHR